MPVDHGVGFSEYTPQKLSDFNGLLRMHVGICKGIEGRYHRPYYYVDLNAGPGLTPLGDEGCAVRAARVLPEFLADYHLFAVDENADAAEKLRAHLLGIANFDVNRADIRPGDNGIEVPEYVLQCPGILRG